jgi:type-F conjugative transfer system pilin assembly protein TrbC
MLFILALAVGSMTLMGSTVPLGSMDFGSMPLESMALESRTLGLDQILPQAMAAAKSHKDEVSEIIVRKALAQDLGQEVSQAKQCSKRLVSETQVPEAHIPEAQVPETFVSATPVSKRCPINSPMQTSTPLIFDTSVTDSHETIVFISNSMPKKTLQDLATTIKDSNTRLVIRGLVNGSFQDTAALVKEIGVPIDIDPELFERLNITQVPTFAIKDLGGAWHTLKGNVSLDYATNKLEGYQ